MEREITKNNVREVVRRGLEEARGNYKIVARMFNLGAGDYKRFLNFLAVVLPPVACSRSSVRGSN